MTENIYTTDGYELTEKEFIELAGYEIEFSDWEFIQVLDYVEYGHMIIELHAEFEGYVFSTYAYTHGDEIVDVATHDLVIVGKC